MPIHILSVGNQIPIDGFSNSAYFIFSAYNDIESNFKDADIFLMSVDNAVNFFREYPDFKVTYIAFSGELAESFLINAGFSNFNRFTKASITKYDEATDIIKEIASSFNTDSSSLRCNVLLYRLLIILCYAITAEYSDKQQRKRMILAPVFERIHNGAEHIDVSLTDLAAVANITPTHLNRLFKEITGETPTKFITKKRLRSAKKKLLDCPDKNIDKIGFECGFLTANHFRQSFKKEYGITPGEYRIQYSSPENKISFIPSWQPLYALNARKYDNHVNIDHISIPPSGYRLTICTYGTGLITEDGEKTHVMNRNDMFLNFPFHKYSCSSLEDSFGIIEISFNGIYAEDILQNFGITESSFFCAATNYSYDFITAIDYIWRNFWTFDKNALLECSYKIQEFLLRLSETSNQEQTHIEKKPVKLGCEIIEKYYMKDFASAEIAKAIGMPYSAFSKEFKEIYGMTPKKYLTKYRINKAAEMLIAYPGMKITQIAKETGFHSSSYFCDIFRQYFNVTPEEYRLRNPR